MRDESNRRTPAWVWNPPVVDFTVKQENIYNMMKVPKEHPQGSETKNTARAALEASTPNGKHNV